MTTPLTDDELREIRERCEAASAGPWEYHVGSDPVRQYIAQACQNNGPRWLVALMMTSDLDEDCREVASVNGPFIAHARTDVPALLAEVDRLREAVRQAIDQAQRGEPAPIQKLQAWREAIGWHAGDFSDWTEEEFALYREVQEQISGKAKELRRETQEELARLRAEVSRLTNANAHLQQEVNFLRRRPE